MAKEAKKIRIRLLRDFWPEESTDSDNRVRAGEVIDVDEKAAKIAMESGLASFEGVAD